MYRRIEDALASGGWASGQAKASSLAAEERLTIKVCSVDESKHMLCSVCHVPAVSPTDSGCSSVVLIRWHRHRHPQRAAAASTGRRLRLKGSTFPAVCRARSLRAHRVEEHPGLLSRPRAQPGQRCSATCGSAARNIRRKRTSSAPSFAMATIARLTSSEPAEPSRQPTQALVLASPPATHRCAAFYTPFRPRA